MNKYIKPQIEYIEFDYASTVAASGDVPLTGGLYGDATGDEDMNMSTSTAAPTLMMGSFAPNASNENYSASKTYLYGDENGDYTAVSGDFNTGDIVGSITDNTSTDTSTTDTTSDTSADAGVEDFTE